MNNRNLNTHFYTDEEVSHFPEIDVQYTVTKDEAWESLSRQLGEPRSISKGVSLNPFYRIAVAASVLVLLCMTGFMRFYTKSISTTAGQHLTFNLPDSSLIELNAQSAVSFHPYWFSFARVITLDGEAFFKVVKGNRFKVVSKRGETTVLGTTFNVFSRDNEYSVTCFTGRVRVVTAEKSERVLLNPNEQAFINKDGFLRFVQEVNSQAVKSWRDNMFIFTGASVVSVLQEIERQYNIKIIFKADTSLTYTGNFSKTLSQKAVLDLVCTSLGLKFEARSDTEFLIN